MFIIRNASGGICGAFTCRQVDQNAKGEFIDKPGVEEIADNDPEVIAFQNRTVMVAKDKSDDLRAELVAKGVLTAKAQAARDA